MSIFNLVHLQPLDSAGVCGNCGLPAINAFENSCRECLEDHGLSSFPLYTYPSVLMHMTKEQVEAAMYYMLGK